MFHHFKNKKKLKLLLVLDVLGRLVLARAMKISIIVLASITIYSRRSEIDQHQIQRVQIDQQILRLQVPMNNSLIKQINVYLNKLLEKVTRLVLGQPTALLRLQIVKQIHAVVQFGHDYNPLVLLLKKLYHFNNPVDTVAHLVQQNLSRVLFIVDHEPILGLVLGYEFNDNIFVLGLSRSFVNLRKPAVSDVSA